MKTLVLMENFTEPIDRISGGHNVRVIEAEGRFLSSSMHAQVLRIHDIVPYSQLFSLNHQARSIAATWYMVGGTDPTYWDELGVSVGDCLRFELGVYIVRYLRHAALLDKLAEDPYCNHILIWGGVPSYLMEFVGDQSTPVTVLLGSKHVLSVLKRMLLRVRVLRPALHLGKNVYRHVKSVTPKSTEGDYVGLGENLRIFAPPDAVLADFIHSLARGLQAQVFKSVKVNESNSEGHQGPFNQSLIADYHSRAEQIVGSREYQELCAAVDSRFMRVMNTWVTQFPARAANIVSESTRFARFLREQRIDLLIMPMTWGGIQRAHIHVAQKMGIPVIMVQDGILASDSNSSVPSVVADYALVLGESGWRWFKQRGIPDECILPVGTLLWGMEGECAVRQDEGNESFHTTRVLYLAPRPPTVGAQHSFFEAEEQIELVCQSLSSCPHLTLMIRFHPRVVDWPGSGWRKHVENTIKKSSRDKVLILDGKETLVSAIEKADIVVCYLSTTIIQVALMHKPVIVVDFSGRKAADYPTKIPAICSTPDELRTTVESIIRGGCESLDGRSDILEGHIYTDCDISEVVDFINRITTASGSKCVT